MNGSGIRDTALVLKVSPTTVIETLKKVAAFRASEYICFAPARISKECCDVA